MSLSKAIVVSVLNQMVSSATNFLFGLYLVRNLPPVEFGLYGIGFAITLFYAGIGNAMFLTQMVVHIPNKAAEDREPYAARICLIMMLFCLVTAFLLVVLVYAGGYFSEWLHKYHHLAIAIIAASTTTLAKDFFIRHCYTLRKEIRALWVNTAVALSLGVFCIVLYLVLPDGNSESYLLLYGLSNGAGVLVGYVLVQIPLRQLDRSRLFPDLVELWSGGKWAAMTVFFYFLRTQAHTLITASLLGPVGVAHLNASRMFVTPAVMLTPALSQVLMPRLATLRASDPRKVNAAGMMFTLVLLSISIVYSLLLLFFLEDIVPFVLGDQYDTPFILVLFWCLLTVVLALRNGMEMVLQILRRFRVLTLLNTISAIIALASVYGMILVFGISGAITGITIGEVVLVLGCFFVSGRDEADRRKI